MQSRTLSFCTFIIQSASAAFFCLFFDYFPVILCAFETVGDFFCP
nr:MAG TPA: hypothetical protein [Caudoviricetes sp.]